MAAAAALARMELKPKVKVASSQEAIKNQGRSSLEAAELLCRCRDGHGSELSPGREILGPQALEGVAGCSWLLCLLGCHRNGGHACPWTPRPGTEHPGRHSECNLLNLHPRNLSLSLIVRRELMAEAAASGKGLSAEEKVQEMVLSLLSTLLGCCPCPPVDTPQHLKPNPNLPALSSVPGFVSFRMSLPQTRKGQLPLLFQESTLFAH